MVAKAYGRRLHMEPAEGPDPTRRPTTRPLRRALAAATLLTATLTACSGGFLYSEFLDQREVERSVAGQAHDDRLERLGAVTYFAACGVEIPTTPGYLFTCTLTGHRAPGGFGSIITERAGALVEVLDSGQVHFLDNWHRHDPHFLAPGPDLVHFLDNWHNHGSLAQAVQ